MFFSVPIFDVSASCRCFLLKETQEQYLQAALLSLCEVGGSTGIRTGDLLFVVQVQTAEPEAQTEEQYLKL